LLANQLGCTQAATSRCLRVMRIAVSARHQGLGIGRWMLAQLSQQTSQADYLATSFGATSELISFWRRSEFEAVHIGHQRDQASGCHSVLMVKALNSNSQGWINQVQNHFERSYCFLVSGSLVSLETHMVRALLPKSVQTVSEFETQLVRNYVNGGNSYDAISFSVLNLILLSNDRNVGISDLLIAKVVQQKEWEACVEQFNLVGRKQAEIQ
ncbi:GNAT family N-acetyltransferase, partial [Vibrio sp. 10N.222.52.B7]|uniref:GNAT family N-acetyltransferase n=1 Tax=Vibrio sp. 10N.222.52.B7 TaxID=3229629 RepID=UPI003554721F